MKDLQVFRVQTHGGSVCIAVQLPETKTEKGEAWHVADGSPFTAYTGGGDIKPTLLAAFSGSLIGITEAPELRLQAIKAFILYWGGWTVSGRGGWTISGPHGRPFVPIGDALRLQREREALKDA